MSTPQSPFAWPGGKRALKKTLLGLIPEHRIYVEVFAGSAKLLFAKPPARPSWRSCSITSWCTPAASGICGARSRIPTSCSALRFAYLAWYSYGAKGEHFASSSAQGCTGNKVRRSLDRVRGLLDQTAARLRNVLIEQRDFAQILEKQLLTKIGLPLAYANRNMLSKSQP